MKTKRTIKFLIGSLATLSCFMSFQQAAAQSFGSRTGTPDDGYVINNNNSNHWSLLRLQTSSNMAWNILNQNGLSWNYSTSNDHGNIGTEMMRLTTGGKLGIGATSPAEKLHVSGGRIRLEGASQTYLSVNETGSNAESRFWTHVDGELYIQNSNGIHFTGINNSSRYVSFLSNGNVGIGTTSPQSKLSVVSSEEDILHISKSTDNAGDNIYLAFSHGDNTASSNVRARIGTNIKSGGEGRLTFHTGNAGNTPERMRIDENGNVGIGEISPSEKLEVAGNIKADGVILNIGSFPDYVFSEEYRITPLAEVEAYVKAHRHLPDMPSEKEVVDQGLNLPEVVTKSVENIEAIYLHLIRMEKEIKALQKENATLKQALKQGR